MVARGDADGHAPKGGVRAATGCCRPDTITLTTIDPPLDPHDLPFRPPEESPVNPATSPDETGVIEVASAFDAELRQDLTSAAWLISAVTIPGLALLAVLVT